MAWTSREEVESGNRVSELARRHQIHPNLIYRWKRQDHDGGPKAFTRSPSGRLKSEAAKIAEHRLAVVFARFDVAGT